MCYFKSATDIQKKVSARPGEKTVACVGKRQAAGDKKISIPAKVPGDLLTDLQNAGVIGDPLVRCKIALLSRFCKGSHADGIW